MHKNLLSTAEVADLLDRTPSAISRMVRRGELTPQVKGSGLRGEMFFLSSDIKALQKADKLYTVGSLWRFKSSKTVYRVISADADLIQLQSTVTEHTRTSVPLRDVARRLVAVEEATA